MQDVLGNIALADFAGPFKDFAEKLGGPNGEEWWMAFKRFLRKENPWEAKLISPTIKIWSVWKALAVGGYSKEQLFKMMLTKEGFKVSDWARDIMEKSAFRTSAGPHDVAFVRATVRDLGFTRMPTTIELFDRSRLAGLGLDLCQPEDAPYIRLAYADQLRGEWLWVAMEPITDSAGDPDVFRVGHRGSGRWLDADYARPEVRWHLERKVILRLRK